MTDKTPAMPEQFTKKPVTIEAFQFKNDGSSYALIRWINEGQHAAGRRFATWRNDEIIVPTLEGEHIASVGDWIIKGVKGEFYPCKPDIFELTYDRAALQSAQPAEVSDEVIEEIARGKSNHVEFARAILALRPAVEPMTLPHVEGDVLPAIGSKVLIHLASSDSWAEHEVVGYYVWEAINDLAKPRHHRVFVRVRDADGILNARHICDVRGITAKAEDTHQPAKEQ